MRLKFEHEFIGDLTADLISPSGQSIQLVGSVGKSGLTKFSKWNVTYVRCKQTAVPDPGFKQKWDNIQPWGIWEVILTEHTIPLVTALKVLIQDL